MRLDSGLDVFTYSTVAVASAFRRYCMYVSAGFGHIFSSMPDVYGTVPYRTRKHLAGFRGASEFLRAAAASSDFFIVTLGKSETYKVPTSPARPPLTMPSGQGVQAGLQIRAYGRIREFLIEFYFVDINRVGKIAVKRKFQASNLELFKTFIGARL